MLAVHEIIVQLYHLGVQAQHLALLCDAQRAAGLAAGGRPGHHHDLGLLLVPEDLVGNLGILALLTRLAEVYEAYGLPVGKHAVQLFDGVDTHCRTPVGILAAGRFDLGNLFAHMFTF